MQVEDKNCTAETFLDFKEKTQNRMARIAVIGLSSTLVDRSFADVDEAKASTLKGSKY